MNIKPLNDRVLILRVEEEEKTAGGIIIPDTAKEKPQQGKVISVGPGRTGEDGKRIPMEVKEGDLVYFSQYGGTEIKVNGIDHIMMREEEILAVIE